MNLSSQKFLTSVVGLLALLAVIIIVNFVASSAYLRWDITEAKTYSLTEGTKKMLSNLDRDVTLKLFYSSSLPGQPSYIKAFAGRVKDLLKEYENNSKGALKLGKLEQEKKALLMDHATIREGENSLTNMWFELCARKLAKERGIDQADLDRETFAKLIEEAEENCPPPYSIDFRMSYDKKHQYRISE